MNTRRDRRELAGAIEDSLVADLACREIDRRAVIAALGQRVLAGARMHFFEIIALRGCTVIPMFIFGYSQGAMHAYILLVYLQSTFVHANLGWQFNRIGKFIVTPRFHHWHHGIDAEAIDVNFAIHFPFLDRLFGTYHLPEGKWPNGYGVEGHPVPRGYWKQMLYPFQR